MEQKDQHHPIPFIDIQLFLLSTWSLYNYCCCKNCYYYYQWWLFCQTTCLNNRTAKSCTWIHLVWLSLSLYIYIIYIYIYPYIHIATSWFFRFGQGCSAASTIARPTPLWTTCRRSWRSWRPWSRRRSKRRRLSVQAAVGAVRKTSVGKPTKEKDHGNLGLLNEISI